MSVLEPGKGVSLWRQIAERLAAEVSAEGFPGGRLPTEPALAARFEVNRHTIRRAVAALAEQGLVRVEQGRGTFVADHMIDYVLGRRTRFSENLQRQGRAPGHRLISSTTAAADDATARDLGLRRGARVVQIETLSDADGVALSYAVHHFPARRFAALPAAFAETNSITAALARCGVTDYTRKLTRLLARLPSEREARQLSQPAARPVLQAEAINVDPAGAPIQRSLVVFAGDRVQMVVAAEGFPE
ncbi:MAG TPA: phosphonate metabolism transcriptional regulator PhnF [Stellaceae bacterium]|nr:phosphonate metabolism transcriptional regulator PhnF [Stellaceae bacterium]